EPSSPDIYFAPIRHILWIKQSCRGGMTLQVLLYISNFIIPFIVLSIVTYGLLSGINVYETFIKGAKSGFLTVIRLMPTLIGLMAAVGILRASGFLDFLSSAIGQFSS